MYDYPEEAGSSNVLSTTKIDTGVLAWQTMPHRIRTFRLKLVAGSIGDKLFHISLYDAKAAKTHTRIHKHPLFHISLYDAKAAKTHTCILKHPLFHISLYDAKAAKTHTRIYKHPLFHISLYDAKAAKTHTRTHKHPLFHISLYDAKAAKTYKRTHNHPDTIGVVQTCKQLEGRENVIFNHNMTVFICSSALTRNRFFIR